MTILEVAGARSNYFICVNDHNGEMQAGAADMELMSHLTPEMVAAHIASINTSEAVVADCNISGDVLQYLATSCKAPLYIDATSAAKAVKINRVLGVNRHEPLIVKVNHAEAVALSGIKGDVEATLRWVQEACIAAMVATAFCSHHGL